MYPGKIGQQFARIKRRHCKVAVKCYTIMEHKHTDKNCKADRKSGSGLDIYPNIHHQQYNKYSHAYKGADVHQQSHYHQTSEKLPYLLFSRFVLLFYCGLDLIECLNVGL